MNDDYRRAAQILSRAAFYKLRWAPSAAEKIETQWRQLTGRQAHDLVRPANAASYGIAAALKTGVFQEQTMGLSRQEATARVLRLIRATAAAHDGELSQYKLTIKSLRAGLYGVKVNGVALPAQLSERAWEQGVNLTASANVQPVNPSEVNPIAAQGRAILGAVAAKEALVSQWRGLSKNALATGAAPDLKEQLAELTKKVEAADEAIRAAAKPQRLVFEIHPAN
jgi:hypothetical protein